MGDARITQVDRCGVILLSGRPIGVGGDINTHLRHKMLSRTVSEFLPPARSLSPCPHPDPPLPRQITCDNTDSPRRQAGHDDALVRAVPQPARGSPHDRLPVPSVALPHRLSPVSARDAVPELGADEGEWHQCACRHSSPLCKRGA